MKESISALIDAELDELDERRVLNALRDDAELRRTWERYHMIRAAATRQLGTLLAPGFAERVLARIEADGESVGRSLRLWPLAGGFAAAALVAAVAFLGVQTFRTPSAPGTPDKPVASLAAAPTATEASSAVPVNTAAARKDLYQERLSIYVVGHNEFMPTARMGSMLPYVRVVAHRPDTNRPIRTDR